MHDAQVDEVHQDQTSNTVVIIGHVVKVKGIVITIINAQVVLSVVETIVSPVSQLGGMLIVVPKELVYQVLCLQYHKDLVSTWFGTVRNMLEAAIQTLKFDNTVD